MENNNKKINIISILVISIIIISSLIFVLIQRNKYSSGDRILEYIDLENSAIMYTAKGERRIEPEKDFVKITQISDVLINVEDANKEDKKKRKEEHNIKKVKINNIEITKQPKKGEVSVISPSDNINKLYTIAGENQIGKELTYIPDNNGNVKVLFRIVNRDIAEKEAPKDAVIENNINLIKDNNVNIEDISFILEYDLNIILNNNKMYKKHVVLNIPNKKHMTKENTKEKLYNSEEKKIIENNR